MIALVLDRDRKARVVDAAPPERVRGEALVRVRAAGVCDTDLQLARGYMDFRGTPGHEFVGDVVAADDERWAGRRVVADINAGCGACEDCLTRDGHHCPTRTVLGILGRQGAFAERVSVPERCLVEVPAGLDDDRAVFAEPLAAALHVLDVLAERRGSRAIVLGDGKLALLIALALRAEGVDTTVVGHHEHKLAIARRAGASCHLEADLPASARGADVVVEATGSERGLARAIELVRPRGAVILKTTVAAPFQIDLAPVVIHELQIVGSRCGDMARAVDALARGAVDPTPLVEARYPLARADEAFAHAARKGALKILVESPGASELGPRTTAVEPPLSR